ncbi:PKD domain-containing protein [Flavobacterium eburneipallidum]|uniref:PKD domain-containing protein n=1 Tax=Flavobacterium eburneipallidum TaxID=3003263 RepID=UPI0024823FD0|nr:PKD domain-containing protein [Flavobacterium eburneipallidum]
MKKICPIIFLMIFLSFGFVLNAKNNNSNLEKKISKSVLAPTATITGNTSVCQNAPSPLVTFTGSGGTAPFTFTYTISGVPGNQTVTTTSGNSVTVAVPTTNTGVFVYTLVSASDSSGAQSQSGSATVRVNAVPTADFTFTNDGTCSGTVMQFSGSATGTGTYTYAWDFGDGTSSTLQNPSHIFTSLGCGTATFTVVLTVTGGGCVVTRTKTITVNQKPDISFSDTVNPFDPFNNCANASSNSVYPITVGNTSASTCISSYSIDWGDGSTQANISFPISHTYNGVGAYSMTITANGTNGCSNSRTYVVKNVSNPLGGLNSPGSTQNLCAPTSNLQFSISNWGGNSLDTTYRINYNDGTPIVVLTQSQLNSSIYYNASNPLSSTNYPVPHVYTTSSCPEPSYRVELEIRNACGTTPVSVGNITVLTKPTANFTVPANNCVNTGVLFTNTTISGYGQNCAQGAIYTWDFGDGSPVVTTPISAPQNISHTYTNPGNYTVTLTAQNFCGPSVVTRQICIEPPLTPAFTLNTTSGCIPLTIAATNTTSAVNACSPPTYVWSVSYVPAYCGTTSTPISNQTTTNASFNFTEAGTYTITLTATNSCGNFPVSQTVTVKRPPTITSINEINANYCGPVTLNPTAIVNSCAPASSTLTYAWSFPGGSPATSSSEIPGAISYTTTGTHIVSLIITNECGSSTTATRSFTINEVPVVTNTPLTQTICSGTTTSLVNLTSSSVGATFSWTATATAGISGFTPSGTSTIPVQTILNTNTNPGTVTYAITPLLGGCPGAVTNYVITVNPAPTITTQPTSSTICQGGSATVLSFTISGATGTPTYQWYSNTSNSNIGGTAISSETNATFNPPSNSAGTFYYYCVITLPTGGCSSISTNPATVTVLPNATIDTQPIATQNLCIGITTAPLTFTYSGGTGTPTIQWYSNTTNSTTGGTAIGGANSASYTPPIFTTPNSYYYYATLSLNGSGCLPVTTTVAEIIVYPDPTISSQPVVSQTLCQTATPANLEVTPTGGNGTFSYQWYSNSINSNTGGTLIPLATNSSYTPPTATVGTRYYYVVVSQNGTSGCSVTSATAQITIITSPTITQPTSSTVCSGGTPTVLTTTVSGATGTPQYQWYSNLANDTSTGTAISGATAASYNPPNTAVGTIYYYVIVTLPSGGCSSITSNTATVTITAGTTISTQPTPNQSLCVGATIATPLTVAYSGGTGTPSYQWYSNTTNSNTGGILISGATSSTFTPPTFTATGNFYYYAVVSLDGNGCGPVSSDPAEIIIVADPVISSQPLASQTVCQSAAASDLEVAVSGGIGTTYSYQWYSNTSNNTTSGTAILGATNATYTPITSSVGTLYYYCVITQAAGSGCNATSATAEVIVNLAPTFTSQPASSTICVGQTPTLLSVSYTNGVGSPTYQWYSNTTNSTTGSTAIANATNASYSPPNTATGTLYYYCIITLPTGGCSNLTSDFTTVTINPNPVISNKTAVICSSKNFVIAPVNSGSEIVPAGTTYTWTNPAISPAGSITGASAQSTAQTEINQTLINTTTSPATVTYTVTPLSGNCPGVDFTIVVTVNPAISANVTASNSTCFSANNGSIQTNITGGIPFSSGNPYQIAWTGPNGFTSSQPNISNLAPGDYNLSVTDQGGCPINETYRITEPQDIIITTNLEKDISCFNAANGEIQITITGGTLNYTIAWTRNGLPFAITEDISNLSPGTYMVTVSDANTCGPKTANFTITEPPILAVSLGSQTNILCFGQATGAINVNVTGGTLPYTYAWTSPNGFTGATEDLTALVAGTYNLIVTDALGCIQNLSVTLTQNPEIKITATTTPIVCYGDNNASISIVVSGGVAPYNIAWSNLGTGTFQNNLSAGDYTITVTDTNNCVQTLLVNIPEAPIFTVNPVVRNISCFGANNGSIALNFVGGIAPVTLTWNDGAVTGTTRNNLGPGTYTVTIVDSKPCTIVRTFTILEPQPLVLSDNTTDALDCNNANTGAINLLVSGGSAPFTYAWSNGATTEDLINISAGNYLVTVTDANGCSRQAQFSINRPPPIVTGVVTQTDFDCDAKTVRQTFVANVSGGLPPYNLTWSSGTVSGANNEIMNTTQNGAVILSVTDKLGCQSNYSFNVAIPTLGTPSFNTNSFAYTTYGTYSINDPIQFTNTATGDYTSVSWDFGDGSVSNEENPVHTFVKEQSYVVVQTVIYPFGCVYKNTVTLQIDKGYDLIAPNGFTPNNDGINDTFKPVFKGLKSIDLNVYDTWGELIYSEKGETLRGWDGKIKGKESENGNYYFKVSGVTFYGATINLNGPFTLIK